MVVLKLYTYHINIKRTLQVNILHILIYLPIWVKKLILIKIIFYKILFDYYLVVTPNINFDLCNFLFCFCFSGPATYIHKDEVASDPCTHISSINWLFEKEMTKSEMINEKHQIKKFSHFMTRLIIFNILLVFLFILPEPLIFIIKFFGTTPEYIHKHSLVYSIIIAKLTVPLVYLFTKISFKAKHLTNMFLLTLSIFLLITYVIKEIIIFI